MESIIAERPKTERETSSLKLETLGKGIGNINAGYSLTDVIKFIAELNAKTSVWTSQDQSELSLVFPTPTLFKINRLKGYESNIYIAGGLKEPIPEYRAQGTRQMWEPKDFLAIISLKGKAWEVDEVQLATQLSKKETTAVIRKSLGNIPDNWGINPRVAKPAVL